MSVDPAEERDVTRGPDRDNPKVRQILAAGRRLFLDQSYGAVSTDQIARAATVSKATLYAHFASKEELFGALITEECSRVANGVWASVEEGMGIEVALRTLGRDFMTKFATSDALALYRIILAEAPRFPVLGRSFFEHGPRIMRARLAAFLAAADARGDLVIPDTDLAATQFIALVQGDIPMRSLVGEETITDAYKNALVEEGVSLFLAGYRPRPETMPAA